MSPLFSFSFLLPSSLSSSFLLPSVLSPLPLFAYLLVVNILTCALLVLDKSSAKLRITRRVPVLLLHLCEAAGGALCAFPLLFIIRHKSAQPLYYLVTGALFFAWLFVVLRFGLA